MSNETTVKLLEATRERLSDFANWCPYGWHRRVDGKEQLCLFATLGDEGNKLAQAMGVLSNYQLSKEPHELLSDAGKVLFPGEELLYINDGKDKWDKVPAEERHKMILSVIDKALAMAKEKPVEVKQEDTTESNG
jgi:hypothetical protein